MMATTMTDDPSEWIWSEYHSAALASGKTGADARAAADKALAEHCERWPRNRRVVTEERHEERIAEATYGAVDRMFKSIDRVVSTGAYDCRTAGRYDASDVLESIRGILQECVTSTGGRLVHREPHWSMPPLRTIDPVPYALVVEILSSVLEGEAATRAIERLRAAAGHLR